MSNQALELPETFSFSQSSLQAFEDCPRRFWLTYVEQLPWPAVEAAPVQDFEELMRLGSTFHRLVERAEIGLDPDLLSQGLVPPLDGWFQAYQSDRPSELPSDHIEVERVLSIPFGDTNGRYRLAAKYDLIAATNKGDNPGIGQAPVMIVDWKTNRRRPDPITLRHRLQTICYPYVLVEASANLPFGPIQPEQVTMLYWFTAAPQQPIRFQYDSAQHAENGERLHQILAKILAYTSEEDFPKVLDTEINRKRFCNYCVYRSRCNRGLTAGDIDELDGSDLEDFFMVDTETALEFTLDQIEELAF
ncbi:PD-(D/E)XK nuclease family protein [Chloroflexi bacterium TSY]|nr:PD-(D/E)XK nuclease family protein [Chloroflexi bacterium TSY]